ncbi:MAG: hypothetical protein EOO01_11920 [Chitinophagaceae bacterium]|nr:MAG: hypothetical protein EOO01_11920 [Chitinophagaceae bacterium]
MKKTGYFKIEELQSVYKATEDCCFIHVAYGGSEIGVKGKLDEEGDELCSWDLFCFCHPRLKIVPIGEKEYLEILQDVNQRRA